MHTNNCNISPNSSRDSREGVRFINYAASRVRGLNFI